jgi:hypothetical protein
MLEVQRRCLYEVVSLTRAVRHPCMFAFTVLVTIVSKFSAHQHVTPWGPQARGRAGRGAPNLTFNPNGCLGLEPALTQGWV